MNADLVWWHGNEPKVKLIARGADLGGAGFISVVRADPNDPYKIWVCTDRNLYLGDAKI